MRVLVLTPIYPWVANPQDAVFVRQQVRSLTREGLRCEVVAFRVLSPRSSRRPVAHALFAPPRAP